MVEKTGKQEYETRITACALIMAADKPETVDAIVADRGVDRETAAIMYVKGALRNAVIRGECHNRVEALEKLEYAQVEDRFVLPHSISPLARDVARIRRVNGKACLQSTDNGVSWVLIGRATKKEARDHVRNDGKVFGELLARHEEAVTALDPAVQYQDSVCKAVEADVDVHCGKFVRAYVASLGKRARAWIEIIKGIEDITMYTTRDAYKAPDTKDIANGLHNLCKSFPVEGISVSEYVELVRRYA